MKEASVAVADQDLVRAQVSFAEAGAMFTDLLAAIERTELLERLRLLATPQPRPSWQPGSRLPLGIHPGRRMVGAMSVRPRRRGIGH